MEVGGSSPTLCLCSTPNYLKVKPSVNFFCGLWLKFTPSYFSIKSQCMFVSAIFYTLLLILLTFGTDRWCLFSAAKVVFPQDRRRDWRISAPWLTYPSFLQLTSSNSYSNTRVGVCLRTRFKNWWVSPSKWIVLLLLNVYSLTARSLMNNGFRCMYSVKLN